VLAARDAIVAMSGTAGAEELAFTGSASIFPNLMAGERQVPGIAYTSFGGNSTIVMRVTTRLPGVGTDCGAKEHDAGLCYPKCASGMKGVGPVCWQQCPSGYSDHGVGCTKPAAYGRGAGYPWKFGDALNDNGMIARCEAAQGRGRCEKNGLIYYPKCKAGFHNVGCCVCSPDCPSGMGDSGATCLKKSAGRGVGTAPAAVFDLFSSTAFPELRNGTGDLLVTDANSRMPWSGTQHITQPLHHGEVLWHIPTMQQVGGLLRKLP
jgi:hypothetical protein